jgi:hypothetical protein
MFADRISNHEEFRLELERHIETNHASAHGRDPRDLQTAGALKNWDTHGSIEAEPVRAPADPRTAGSVIGSAVLTVASAMQEAIAATELVTLKIEAAPFRPELVDLVARLQAVDVSMRALIAAMAKTNVLTARSTS